jgi:GMP synthase (glutamine-hydrolysing)
VVRPHLLVVQNAEHEGLGHLAPAFDALGLTWQTVDAWDGDRVPSSLGDHLGLVLLGGPQSVYLPEQWPYLEREMALVREAHAIRAPVLGICLGAQLVAHALGGRVMRGDAGPEMGYAPLVLTDEGRADPLTRALGGDLPVLHLHHDTYALPPGATRLASTARYREQAFRVGDRTYALQFHPEFTVDMLERILPGESKDLAAAGVDADTVLAQARALDARTREAARAVAEGFVGCGCFP